MTNIKDLLKSYAKTCKVIGLGNDGMSSWLEQKANLESQIIKLFEEARSEGAQVEREEMAKFFEGHPYCRMADQLQNICDCSEIAQDIRERGNQSDEGKGGE